jgi:hypothetical protein
MKRANAKIWVLTIFISVNLSCSKSSNISNVSCNASYSEIGGLQADGPVEYLSDVSGNGGTKISSISYQDSAGTTTVNNPSLPWTKTVNLKKGSGISITAIGNSYEGDTINVSAFANGSQGGASCP